MIWAHSSSVNKWILRRANRNAFRLLITHLPQSVRSGTPRKWPSMSITIFSLTSGTSSCVCNARTNDIRLVPNLCSAKFSEEIAKRMSNLRCIAQNGWITVATSYQTCLDSNLAGDPFAAKSMKLGVNSIGSYVGCTIVFSEDVPILKVHGMPCIEASSSLVRNKCPMSTGFSLRSSAKSFTRRTARLITVSKRVVFCARRSLRFCTQPATAVESRTY